MLKEPTSKLHFRHLTSIGLDVVAAQRSWVQQLLPTSLGHRLAQGVGLPRAMAVHVQDAVAGLDDLRREHPRGGTLP